jgi:2-haloacid dehalogenase
MQRWATFDCYGTLIDWNGGIRAELADVFGAGRVDEQLGRYHEVEPELEADGLRAYREVLTEAMRRLGAPPGREYGLAESLPGWEAFPEVPAALQELRARGWRLALLSNTDPDLIAASQVQIGVPFDEVVVASEIGSYKPAHKHWSEFFARTGAPPEGHVHVAASLFHDIAPARELGLKSIWINRLGEQAPAGSLPDRELPDLVGLPATLDELVPAPAAASG